MNMASCLLLVSPNFQTLTGLECSCTVGSVRKKRRNERKNLDKGKNTNGKIEPNKPIKKKPPDVPFFFCDDNAVFCSESQASKNRADYVRILLHATVALKIKPVLLFSRRKGKLAGLRTSLVPLADSRGGMKRLTCSAKLFFPLSGCLSGRQEPAREKGEKWTYGYVPSFSESVIFFWPFPNREEDRERGPGRLKWAKITRCILSKTSLLPLCQCV